MTAAAPLAGYTVAVTAARRREEFGTALERRGAKVITAPAIRIVPLPDDTELQNATARCLSAPIDFVVATTGIGFRGWMDAAETWGLAEPLLEAIGASVLLTRGPKARGAVRAAGLREAWSPESESSEEVVRHLLNSYRISGRRIAVQLHGEPQPAMVDALRGAGADVIEIPVYRWVPPDDPAPLHRLIETVAAAGIDAVAFTSAPAAASFLQAAREKGCASDVIAALRGPVLAACVGPVTAHPLTSVDIPVIRPARCRLGALVREIVEQLPARRGRIVPAAGHRLDIRGHAVILDGRLISLTSTGAAVLHMLARRPGHVVARSDLLAIMPGEGGDEHAVEVAVGRLRTALGDPRIIRTVVKRGYRIAD